MIKPIIIDDVEISVKDTYVSCYWEIDVIRKYVFKLGVIQLTATGV
jgi:hypothetical protein